MSHTRSNTTSDKLLSLLRQKHAEDLLVPQCRNGATVLANPGTLGILDAVVSRKSWANPSVIGYEIKSSRQDFLSDDKWGKYRDCCNEFSFVCPWKAIREHELPPEIGLYWASKNFTRLFTRRKPQYIKAQTEGGVVVYSYCPY